MVVTIPGMTTSEVARALGLSSARIRQLLQAGELPYRQTALGRLVDPEDVAWLRVEREPRQKGTRHERA